MFQTARAILREGHIEWGDDVPERIKQEQDFAWIEPLTLYDPLEQE